MNLIFTVPQSAAQAATMQRRRTQCGANERSIRKGWHSSSFTLLRARSQSFIFLFNVLHSNQSSTIKFLMLINAYLMFARENRYGQNGTSEWIMPTKNERRTKILCCWNGRFSGNFLIAIGLFFLSLIRTSSVLFCASRNACRAVICNSIIGTQQRRPNRPNEQSSTRKPTTRSEWKKQKTKRTAKNCNETQCRRSVSIYSRSF